MDVLELVIKSQILDGSNEDIGGGDLAPYPGPSLLDDPVLNLIDSPLNLL